MVLGFLKNLHDFRTIHSIFASSFDCEYCLTKCISFRNRTTSPILLKITLYTNIKVLVHSVFVYVTRSSSLDFSNFNQTSDIPDWIDLSIDPSLHRFRPVGFILVFFLTVRLFSFASLLLLLAGQCGRRCLRYAVTRSQFRQKIILLLITPLQLLSPGIPTAAAIISILTGFKVYK